MITAGKLNHRLTLQRPVHTSDGLGVGGTITWTTAFTIWAERWSISGNQRVEAARAKQNSMFRWHVRFHAGIVPSMRIKWVDNGKTHYQEIISVTQIGNNNAEIEILAEEKI